MKAYPLALFIKRMVAAILSISYAEMSHLWFSWFYLELFKGENTVPVWSILFQSWLCLMETALSLDCLWLAVVVTVGSYQKEMIVTRFLQVLNNCRLVILKSCSASQSELKSTWKMYLGVASYIGWSGKGTA